MKKLFVDKNGVSINTGDIVCHSSPAGTARSQSIYLAEIAACGCRKLLSLGVCHFDGCDHRQHYGGFHHIDGRWMICGSQSWESNSEFPSCFEVIGKFWENPEMFYRDANWKKEKCRIKDCNCHLPQKPDGRLVEYV